MKFAKFEALVLEVVAEFIPKAHARFFFGTLFVSGVTKGQAALLFNRIRGVHFGEVIMSYDKSESEYSFDFC